MADPCCNFVNRCSCTRIRELARLLQDMADSQAVRSAECRGMDRSAVFVGTLHTETPRNPPWSLPFQGKTRKTIFQDFLLDGRRGTPHWGGLKESQNNQPPFWESFLPILTHTNFRESLLKRAHWARPLSRSSEGVFSVQCTHTLAGGRVHPVQ